jgi:hypothetical protein
VSDGLYYFVSLYELMFSRSEHCNATSVATLRLAHRCSQQAQDVFRNACLLIIRSTVRSCHSRYKKYKKTDNKYIINNGLQWARASSLSRIHAHTQTLHFRQDFSGRVTSPTQRRLPDNTQDRYSCHRRDSNPQSQQERGAAEPHLRPRGHWNQPESTYKRK